MRDRRDRRWCRVVTLLGTLVGTGACVTHSGPHHASEMMAADGHGGPDGMPHGDSHGVDQVQGPFDWDGYRVTRFHRHFFGGQADGKALKAARANGVTAVVNLREKDEAGFVDSRAEAERLGLKYHHVPVSRTGPLDRGVFESIEEIHRRNPGPVLVYCGSGSRAAAWFTVHLSGMHAQDSEPALAVGRRLGLSDKDETRVRDLLGK